MDHLEVNDAAHGLRSICDLNGIGGTLLKMAVPSLLIKVQSDALIPPLPSLCAMHGKYLTVLAITLDSRLRPERWIRH